MATLPLSPWRDCVHRSNLFALPHTLWQRPSFLRTLVNEFAVEHTTPQSDPHGCLAFHPLEPFRPPLRRRKRLGVVAGLSKDLSVAQLEDEHDVIFPPTTIVDDLLNNPQPIPYQHAAQPPGRSRL